MRNLFADPAFPDIVGEWAEEEIRKSDPSRYANDNDGKKEKEESLIALVARAEVEASRVW